MSERALVLGGGGAAGNAWEIGVIAGLSDAGVDVTAADLTIGTSAGATVAAQVTSATLTELFAAVLADAPAQPPTGRAGAEDGRPAARPTSDHLERTNRIIAAAHDAADMRRRMGAAALELDEASDGSGSARWRAVTAARLPSQRWPDRTVLITAVDARTGEPVVFDRDSVELVDAIAASTSSGAPYRIGDNRYIDGGYRRNENADLASGSARVLVLSTFGGRSRHPWEWGMQLAAQVAELREGGSRVETLVPDASAEHLFGANALDPSLRAPAARAGYAQGMVVAPRVAELWR